MNGVPLFHLSRGLKLRPATLGRDGWLLWSFPLVIRESWRNSMISRESLHIFKVLRLFHTRLTVLDNTASHIWVPSRHAWLVLRVVALTLRSSIWIGIALEGVVYSLREGIRIGAYHASISVKLTSSMMIFMKVFVLILHYHLLENLMRVVLISLRLMYLFRSRFLSCCLAILCELPLHLSISHTIKVDSIGVLVFESS